MGSTWLHGRGGVMDLSADPPAVPPTRRAALRIVLLLGLHLMATCGLLALYAANGGRFGAVDPVLGVAAAFALVGLLPMEVELGRSTLRFTLVEGVLVVALFTLGPIGVVATATVGCVPTPDPRADISALNPVARLAGVR